MKDRIFVFNCQNEIFWVAVIIYLFNLIYRLPGPSVDLYTHIFKLNTDKLVHLKNNV